MNKDHSFEQIDFTKLLLWICLLAVLIFSIWAALVIPATNAAHSGAEELAELRANLQAQMRQLEHTKEQINSLESTNHRELVALIADFDQAAFIEFCKTFFEEARLEDNLLPDSGEYQNYKLLVSAKLSSPSSFYDFLDSLNNYTNILRVDFPIVMKRSEELIHAQFNIKVYKGKKPALTLPEKPAG